jgi:nitrite reductase (cytochrome c-552)
MNESRPRSLVRNVFYVATLLVVAAATAGVMYLWQNINDRREEGKQHVFEIVKLTEDTIDPAEWGKNFPRQYDSYIRTVDVERTRYGGSEAFQKLDVDEEWRTFWAGYAFSVDFREERGHAYMLHDQEETERVKQFKQPGACLQCHASVLPAYRYAGKKAGVPDDQPEAQIQKGFEVVCAMPYAEAHALTNDKGEKLLNHPVTCLDCHNPENTQLRVTRPGFLNGIRDFARSDQPAPHLPSIERWRKGDRKTEYNPNRDASRQEMRSYVCGQCHVEYYFKGKAEKVVTYPWANGLKVEQIEAHYDQEEFSDWKHKITEAPMLKAQHPEFETWSQGIHARSGVSCADCHMPYKREGAIKISDHHVRSPLLNISRACQTCHRYPEEEILARANGIQDRTRLLLDRAEGANLAMIEEIQKAMQKDGASEQLGKARDLHRAAQFRLDFVSAENSMGFHASQEVARILGEAIDLARQGQIEAIKVQTGHQPAEPATEKKELRTKKESDASADAPSEAGEK